MKQAVKKGVTVKKQNADDLMGLLGIQKPSKDEKEFANADKEMDFYVMPKAFKDALSLPGFPIGYMSLITGWSNTGKSTMVNCLIASAMNRGDFVVIYDTENNFDFSYAIDCGMKATPVYGMVEKVNEVTGEVTEKEAIVNYEGDFLYFNTDMLLKAYGKVNHKDGSQAKTMRETAVLEDIAYSMTDIIRKVKTGDFDRNILFVWDSVGSIGSFRSYESKVGNNMFDAGALSQAFNTIINQSIPTSKKVNSNNTFTFVCVNKIWDDSSQNPMAGSSFALKGGKSFFYSARLIIHLGGVQKSAVKKLSAVSKGIQYTFGNISKATVNKNQLPSPWTMFSNGEIACVHNGMVSPDDVDAYKKEHMKVLIDKLSSMANSKGKEIDVNNITFIEEEVVDD